KTASFRIQSDDPNSPLDLPAAGTGVTGVIRLTGDLNFGTVARGTSAARAVDIENIGEGFLHVSAWSMTGDSRFIVDEATPGSPIEIAPGSKITIHVRFSPLAADGPGTHTATLHVTNDTPGNTDATKDATGDVGVPQTAVSSASLDFGGVPVDNRTTPHVRDLIVTVFNQASCNFCDVTVSGMAITGPQASDFTLVAPPTFPYTIGAGNHLDVTVRFNPQDAGPRSATLTISSNDPASPSIVVALSGSGLIPGIATPHDTTVAGTLYFPPTVYSPVCVSPCGTTLTEPYQNNGAAELIVDSIAFTGSPAFSGPPATTPPSRFAPNSGGSEPILFNPTAAARKLTGVMTITDSMGPSPTAAPVTRQVALCGEGVGRGFRVLAVNAAGTPYAQLKSLKLISHGFRNNVNTNLKNLNLTTLNPPTVCRQVQFQYENQNLPDTTRAGSQGAYYDLTITVGNKAKTISFTLGINEFKEIVMTIP
ncbi:MAG TPA: choice-of-anchor D domain-containing protein, partial [Actinomycetota bacterium]|nr:choice-of-anchor D domain-containing protein [Actinomycetota bacterium]